jgi:hypothetical protein
MERSVKGPTEAVGWASLQGKMDCPGCPLMKNRPKGDLQRLLELFTISNAGPQKSSGRFENSFKR